MCASEGFRTLRNWLESKTVLDLLVLSFSDWPFWQKVHIDAFTDDPPVLKLVEENSRRELPPVDLEGAELRWADPEDSPWPFEGVSLEEFKGFLFMKLTDGKHLVMAERRPVRGL